MFSATLRRAFKMNGSISTAPFSKAVVRAMRKLYPEELADKSWDNTGLLLESPFDPLRRQMNSVLLTVDLTKAVADEAIERKDSIIVSYHPIIFRGLKSITLDDSQQQSLLRLAAEGISVYSPHTALDAAPGGLGDWLADIVTGTTVPAAETMETSSSGEEDFSQTKPPINLTDGQDDPFTEPKRPVYLLHHPSNLSSRDPVFKLASVDHTRESIKPLDLPSHPDAGMGRIVRFSEPEALTTLISRIAHGLGNPKGFPIAIPQKARLESMRIRSVGICAGSGASLLTPLRDVDLLFTGELSHHEALAAIERGQCVITLFHSNTERGFLHGVLKEQLEAELREEWDLVRNEEREKGNMSDDMIEALDDDEVEVGVSEMDRDPYGIVIGT